MPRLAASSDARTYVPDESQESAIADFVQVLDQAGVDLSHPRPALIAPDGSHLEIPTAMFDVLRQVAEALSNGLGVTVAPQNAVLTTQQAADYLGISRPTFVRILERGEIPMQKPGRHRFVRLQDLIEYQQQYQANRRESLETMVAEATDDDLYARTDGPPPTTR